MRRRTRNVQERMEESKIPVGHVDMNNVAFCLSEDDVALIHGGLDFAEHIGKTVWNYVDVPIEEDEE